MTGENFLTAFSKDRFRLANNVCKIFWHFVTIVAYERKHALEQDHNVMSQKTDRVYT